MISDALAPTEFIFYYLPGSSRVMTIESRDRIGNFAGIEIGSIPVGPDESVGDVLFIGDSFAAGWNDQRKLASDVFQVKVIELTGLAKRAYDEGRKARERMPPESLKNTFFHSAKPKKAKKVVANGS